MKKWLRRIRGAIGMGLTWGGLLAAIFVLAVALGRDPAFLSNLVVVGPFFAVAGAGSAAGSLALARRAKDRELLEPTGDMTAVGPSAGEP